MSTLLFSQVSDRIVDGLSGRKDFFERYRSKLVVATQTLSTHLVKASCLSVSPFTKLHTVWLIGVWVHAWPLITHACMLQPPMQVGDYESALRALNEGGAKGESDSAMGALEVRIRHALPSLVCESH